MFNLANKIHTNKINLARDNVIRKAESLGADASKFTYDNNTPLDCFPIVSSDFRESNGELAHDSFIPPYETKRYHGTFRLWKSVPREEYESHWTSEVCTANQKYFAMFMEEYYGKNDLLGNYFTSVNAKHGHEPNSNETALSVVGKHDVLLKIDGVGLLIWTEAVSDLLNIDVIPFIKHRFMVHPYCASPSVHEFFRLLLEWQWAYQNLGSREIMANVANEYLGTLGLDVSNTDDKVVQSLLSLPDQQVSQYIKTGQSWLNEEEVDCPEEFYNWTKEIMELINLSHSYKKLLTRQTV